MNKSNRRRPAPGSQMAKLGLLGRIAQRRPAREPAELAPGEGSSPELFHSPSCRPSGRRFFLELVAVIAVVTAAFLYQLHVSFEAEKLDYQIRRAERAVMQLVLERRELRLERESLRALDRVQSDAESRLGMKIPNHERIIPVVDRRGGALASGRTH